MPKILDAPCLDSSNIASSPGFSFGRPGPMTAGTFLNRPGGTPSNSTGVNFGLLNGSLDVIAVGTNSVDTYELTLYQHDGNFENPTTIAVVNIVALKKAVLVKDTDFTQLATLDKNRQIAIEITDGTATNIGVDLQLSGDVSV